MLSLGGNMGGMAKVSKLWWKATKIPPGVSRLKAPGVTSLAWGNSMQMYSILIHFRGLHNSLCSLTRWIQQPGFLSACFVWRPHVKKRHSNIGWCKLACRLWTLKIFNKLYNTWVLLMGPRKPQVHVKWMGRGQKRQMMQETSPSIKI